jgi:hypothetical protein
MVARLCDRGERKQSTPQQRQGRSIKSKGIGGAARRQAIETPGA